MNAPFTRIGNLHNATAHSLALDVLAQLNPSTAGLKTGIPVKLRACR